MRKEKRPSILYIVNFYGTPPLNFLERYINETDVADISIMKLPAVRPAGNKLALDASFKSTFGDDINVSISFWFPFPLFLLYIFQYIINGLVACYFLMRSKKKIFSIVIGEASFGGALAYFINKLGIAKYSVYMNGDVLPELRGGEKPFYFSSSTSKIVKVIDTALIYIQYILRGRGIRTSLVWYPNTRILNWDKKHGLIFKDHIVVSNIMVDHKSVLKNLKIKREGNVLSYIGRLDLSAGVDFSLKCISHIKEELPDIKFLAVGGGSVSVEKYTKMAEELGIKNNVEFYGFVPEMDDAYEIIKKARLGLAFYNPDKTNISMFSEPAKPKEYIKQGLPVAMIRDGPVIGDEIHEAGAGILTKNDPKEAAKRVVEVLQDQDMYDNLLEGVRKYSSQYDYKPAFKNFLAVLFDRYEKASSDKV